MATTNKKGNVSSMQGMEIKEEAYEKPKKGKITGITDLTFADGEKAKILGQVQAEYKFATRGLDTWIDSNLKRLKLYNNQKRDPEFVGEPLLFTHMNTWLAFLYEDEHDKEWIPREDGDIEASENLSSVSEYDAELMQKAELDYNLGWDALFFSYGLVDMLEFDLNMKCTAPSLIDPIGFYYDTLSSSIDGNIVNRGGMRFLGWDMYMSEREIRESMFMNADALDILKKSDTHKNNSRKDEAREQRMEAIGGDIAHFENNSMGDNNIFEVLQWRTWWKGKKVLLLLTADCQDIIGAKVLPVDENGKPISWWVSSKRFNPQPHQFKGMSLPDMLEDKQRKKAVLVNDALNLSRITVYGSHAYDENRIDNVADLQWGYDKWIAVDGDPRTAIAPVYKDSPNLPLIDNLLAYLDNSAQTASATPSLQQGVLSEQQRTLGELELVSQSSKTRYSLALKTFAEGDRDFWGLYYAGLKVHLGNGLGKKIVRIAGSPTTFRKLSRKDIICKVDPDIRITSRTLSEAKKMREFGQFMSLLELTLNDPDADKRAILKKAYYLSGRKRDEIDELLPPTADEVIAKEQNEMISRGEEPPFLENDNHLTHIRVHKDAIENSIKANHIALHIEALKMIQENPQLAPQEMQIGTGEGEVLPTNQSGAGAGMGVPSPSQEAGMMR